MSQKEDLSNLRNLVGAENVLAECAGVNYTVCVTDSRLLVGKRFALGEKYVNVPHAEVSTLELITNVCCSRGDSCFSRMVVSRSGEAEFASSAIRPSAHRHLRRVLGRGGGYLVEEEGGGAEDRNLRNQGAYHGKASSRLESRERVQGSERLACFSRSKNRRAATGERGLSAFSRRAGAGKSTTPGGHILVNRKK